MFNSKYNLKLLAANNESGSGKPEDMGGNTEEEVAKTHIGEGGNQDEAPNEDSKAINADDQDKTLVEDENVDKSGDGTDEELPKPSAQTKDWRDKEIGRKHAKNKELEKQLADERAEKNHLRQMLEAATIKNPDADNVIEKAEVRPAILSPDARRLQPDSGNEFQQAVHNEAARLAALTKYNEDCNVVADTGKKAYGNEWDAAMSNIATLGILDQETMNGVLATDNPAKVLYELGASPEKLQNIMELPPAKRIAEMTKMSIAKAAKPKISDAPPPIEPVKGRNDGDPNDLTNVKNDDEWFAKRRAQKRAKLEAQHAR